MEVPRRGSVEVDGIGGGEGPREEGREEGSHPHARRAYLPSRPEPQGLQLRLWIVRPLLICCLLVLTSCCSPQYTYEASIPYLNTRSALIELEAWYTKEMWDPKGLRPHFPIEIRFAEKDDIYLSPTYGARGTYIGAIQYRYVSLPRGLVDDSDEDVE
jgi:hypothetical protein